MIPDFDIDALRANDRQELLEMTRYVYDCCKRRYSGYKIYDKATVEDMTQKKMLKFYERRTFHRISDKRYLINSINISVSNNVATEIKTTRRYKFEYIDNGNSPEIPDESADVLEDPEESLGNLLQEIHKKLTRTERRAFSIFEREWKWDYDRICDELGIERNNAYQIVGRIKCKVRKLIQLLKDLSD